MASVKVAALYIRVSTEDQLEFSPEAQKKALLQYAGDNGFRVDRSNIFIDEGVSGRRAEKRPAFMEMIAKAKTKAKPFEAILVHKFDRFARSREDSVVYKSLLKKECGVRVISITESIEDDKFSIILEAMLEAMAEYYSLNLAEEVKKGMTEKALAGGLQTSPPFGYAVKDNKLIPVEEEACLVKEMFYRFLVGEGYYPLSRWLNDIGAKTHRGNPFVHRTVEYMIRNPVYIGKLRWNPKGKTGREYENEHIILADAGHEPLIDCDTWEAAQKQVANIKSKWKYHGRPASEYKDWLSGIVRCSACNSTLVFSKPHYWKCNGYAKGACKTSQHIKDDRIKAAILTQLGEDFQSKQNISYKKLHPANSDMDAVGAWKLQVSKLEKKLERLRTAYLEGIETIDTYKNAKQAVEMELIQANSRISQISKADAEANRQPATQSMLELIHSPIKTKEEKHSAIASVIDTCVFDKGKNVLEIQYRYLAPNS